ncbi:primosomal protein N' [Lichenihabitans psoromatis]|uniref:primosomal protein N' n=1 Tax=Lichenihabitans psoromatis TaxID=2528642 RepID=UPI001035BC1F|nr:primosomal protein N' [Lichenihabitans psoromatis]
MDGDDRDPASDEGHPNRVDPTVVDVLIPVGIDQAYSYRVPAGLRLDLGDVVEVPLGTRPVFGVVWESSATPAGGANLKQVVARFPVAPIAKPLRDLVDWVARWTLTPRGLVLRMVTRRLDESKPDPIRLGYRRSGTLVTRSTPARSRVLDALAAEEPLSKAALSLAAQCSAIVIEALAADGVLLSEALPPKPVALPPDPTFAGHRLDAGQEQAAEALREAIAAKAFSVSLLDGVTGAGKTDVYFEAVAATIAAGRQVLILLPEIALTSQFIGRFAARFGVPPAEWHSEIGGKRRTRIWSGVASGEVRVVAGARSSLFLPFADLGLIVVDEEHEAAYKQEDGVTYHARDMAVVRGQLENIPVILASATPSVETRVNAERGRYRHLRLPTRFGGRALPMLSAIDLRTTPPPRGQWIAPPLVEAMQATHAAGQQTLLYLNRRGYAPLTLCRTCGHRLRCPQCSAWLVEHRFRGALVCHHCGHQEPRPKHCPECDAVDSLVACGPGVERLAENVQAQFPDAKTLLLSSDFPGGAAKLREELAAIAEGDVDIIIGTQLVAKGHHFPRLTLVGVIDADVGLSNGDPRAAERTFQMLQQVTGRAGRGDAPGRGMIQTFQPGHPVIRALLSGDTERFYASEIASRQDAELPPFGRLAAVIVSGTDRHAAETHARALARAALSEADQLRTGVERGTLLVLGPAEAPLAMVRGRYRFRLLVKTARSIDLQGFLRRTLKAAPRPRGNVTVNVDVDPQSFL